MLLTANRISDADAKTTAWRGTLRGGKGKTVVDPGNLSRRSD